MRFIARTETGRNRNHNQDRIWAGDRISVCAVLDGCGAYGKPADIVLEAIRRHLESVSDPCTLPQLVAATRAAEGELFRRMQKDRSLHGGTTLDLLAFGEHGLVALHAGDGRIYRVRDGTLDQLSTDHRLVAEMVARGEIAESQARTHPSRNVLTRSITGAPPCDLEVIHADLLPGDVFVACTDGVWAALEPEYLEKQLAAFEPHVAIETILASSELAHDNASMVIAWA